MALRETDHDTIAAIATAPGEGGIGIVRLSGRAAITIAGKIFRPKNGSDTASQKTYTARYGHVVSRTKGSERIVDEGVLLIMRAPKSYTAEDVAEIQVHGGTAVLEEVLASAVREGARLAGPGEFTKRAFLNGRLDLVQAEAVLDLIQARAEKSRQWASARLDGSLSRRFEKLKFLLIETMSALEAAVDFPEDDLDARQLVALRAGLSEASAEIGALLEGSALGLLAKRGTRAVFWGRPNTGKSSLMNRLVGQSRVIVAPLPGTTRDVVEEEIQIRGFPVRLADTAGIASASDPVEIEGVARSRRAAMEAGVVLFVLDASAPLTPDDKKIYDEIRLKPKIIVLNKSDLPGHLRAADAQALDPAAAVVCTSCVSGGGITELENEILRQMTGGKADITDDAAVGSVRQKEAVVKMRDAVDSALEACGSKLSPELIAVDVRLALNHLGELVGEITTDEILDTLFAQFCIGK